MLLLPCGDRLRQPQQILGRVRIRERIELARGVTPDRPPRVVPEAGQEQRQRRGAHRRAPREREPGEHVDRQQLHQREPRRLVGNRRVQREQQPREDRPRAPPAPGPPRAPRADGGCEQQRRPGPAARHQREVVAPRLRMALPARPRGEAHGRLRQPREPARVGAAPRERPGGQQQQRARRHGEPADVAQPREQRRAVGDEQRKRRGAPDQHGGLLERQHRARREPTDQRPAAPLGPAQQTRDKDDGRGDEAALMDEVAAVVQRRRRECPAGRGGEGREPPERAGEEPEREHDRGAEQHGDAAEIGLVERGEGGAARGAQQRRGKGRQRGPVAVLLVVAERLAGEDLADEVRVDRLVGVHRPAREVRPADGAREQGQQGEGRPHAHIRLHARSVPEPSAAGNPRGRIRACAASACRRPSGRRARTGCPRGSAAARRDPSRCGRCGRASSRTRGRRRRS